MYIIVTRCFSVTKDYGLHYLPDSLLVIVTWTLASLLDSSYCSGRSLRTRFAQAPATRGAGARQVLARLNLAQPQPSGSLPGHLTPWEVVAPGSGSSSEAASEPQSPSRREGEVGAYLAGLCAGNPGFPSETHCPYQFRWQVCQQGITSLPLPPVW